MSFEKRLRKLEEKLRKSEANKNVFDGFTPTERKVFRDKSGEITGFGKPTPLKTARKC